MTKQRKAAKASLDAMYRVFTVPEAPNSTLSQIEQRISQNINGFLQDHIVAVEKDLREVEKDFADSDIPQTPTFVSEHADFLLKKLVAQSVHTSSPSFIGHMTSALPYFMLPLSKVMIALNQNLVKTETSKAFTPLERQVIGMLHRLVYANKSGFYKKWMHDSNIALGAMCSGGTVANLAALWVARNNAFPASKNFKGIEREGVFRAIRHHGHEGAAILVSRLGHYSLSKASDILGFGRDFIVPVDTDVHNRIDLAALRQQCEALRRDNIKLVAIVGVAGATETGSIDPLTEMAQIAHEYHAHFHVDAAWGGPTLFSNTHKHLLKGIELADSVTIDAHKQLYTPMGAGLVLFKNPRAASSIEHHAQYIIRKGSKDLGSKTIEGSRPGMAMLIYSGLKVIGKDGYEMLIDQGIEKAKLFADLINDDPAFELISEPELNILTYRYCPPMARKALDQASPPQAERINDALSKMTKRIQKTQRAHGKAFVSRTRIYPAAYGKQAVTVFRVVLANPLTTPDILRDILIEQKAIVQEDHVQAMFRELEALCLKATA